MVRGDGGWLVRTTAIHNTMDHPPTTSNCCVDVLLHRQGWGDENEARQVVICGVILGACMGMAIEWHAVDGACITSMNMGCHHVPELPDHSGRLQLQLRSAHGRFDLSGGGRSIRCLYSTGKR